MLSSPQSAINTLARRVSRLAAAGRLSNINRAVVLDTCGSTQDEAHRLAAGVPGLLVTADRQEAGRGRLGRAWADTRGLGIAATFVLDASERPAELVSLACGLAACIVCERAWARGQHRTLAQGAQSRGVGLKWPNDVVECAADSVPGRKLAGVLVERRGNLLLAGIGINIDQQAEDFPPEIHGKAASLRMIGANARRLTTLTDLALVLDATLSLSRESIVAAWLSRDLVTGREATFEHDGHRFDGRVLSIQPLGEIEVRVAVASFARLPALQTTMVPGTLR